MLFCFKVVASSNTGGKHAVTQSPGPCARTDQIQRSTPPGQAGTAGSQQPRAGTGPRSPPQHRARKRCRSPTPRAAARLPTAPRRSAPPSRAESGAPRSSSGKEAAEWRRAEAGGGQRGALSPAVTEDARSRGAGRAGSAAHPPAAPAGPEATLPPAPARPGGRGRRPRAARPARRPVPARCPAGSPPLPPRPPRSAPRTPRRPRSLWRAHTLRVTTLGAASRSARSGARGVGKEKPLRPRARPPGKRSSRGGHASAHALLRSGAEERLGSCSSREAALPSARPGSRTSLSAGCHVGPPSRGCGP